MIPRLRRRHGLAFLALSLILLPPGFLAADSRMGAFLILASVVASALATILLTLAPLLRAFRGATVSWWASLASLGMALLAALPAAALVVPTLLGDNGRPLRRRGRCLLPPLGSTEEWSALRISTRVPDGLRAGIADAWRRNGRAEHASVAAFAHLVLDLISLGAPPHLIRDAIRDGQDEIRHAELCFSIAHAMDGRNEGPRSFADAGERRPLPHDRTEALALLAVEAVRDGAFGEGVAAGILARLAAMCPDASVRDVVAELAADENRHAGHGWDVVEWCVAQGGAPVEAALQSALGAIPPRAGTSLPDEARSGTWQPHGVAGEALELEEYQRVRSEVIQRVRLIVCLDQAPFRLQRGALPA